MPRLKPSPTEAPEPAPSRATGSRPATATPTPLELRHVVALWTPLALSWLLMAVELPLLSAVVARLDDPKVHLAAYGGIVFPISLVIEGPIIMLLAASTALCTHWRSYLAVRRFMLVASAVLTLIHIAVAFTPLYDVVALQIMRAPPEIAEPARWGLQIMTPWTWSIAYRRFQQGVLIRNGHSREVTRGTAVRLIANASTLALGASLQWPGIIVGSTAVAVGVITEAIYVGICVRPVLEAKVRNAPVQGAPLTVRSFLHFYVPLAMTPLITLFIQPLGAAAMNRMPNALESLAAWPAVHGLVFLTRSVGMAYNEVVVTLVDRPGAVPVLRRFNRRLALATMGVLFVLAATPLSGLWFSGASGLPPEVAELCRVAVALAVLMPGYAVLQSWFQGTLVRHRTTRAITEAVLLYFVITAGLLELGIGWQPFPGLYWAILTFTTAGIVQTGWLWWRSRGALADYAARDRARAAAEASGGTPA